MKKLINTNGLAYKLLICLAIIATMATFATLENPVTAAVLLLIACFMGIGAAITYTTQSNLIGRLVVAIQQERLQVACILVVGFIVRIWEFAVSALWYDESFTMIMARLPIDRLIMATAGDVHPPLFYLLVKLWLQFSGDSIAGIRSFSAACSMAGLWVFYLLMCQYTGKKIS